MRAKNRFISVNLVILRRKSMGFKTWFVFLWRLCHSFDVVCDVWWIVVGQRGVSGLMRTEWMDLTCNLWNISLKWSWQTGLTVLLNTASPWCLQMKDEDQLRTSASWKELRETTVPVIRCSSFLMQTHAHKYTFTPGRSLLLTWTPLHLLFPWKHAASLRGVSMKRAKKRRK